MAEDERRISGYVAMTAGDCASDYTICSVWLDRLSERESRTDFFHLIYDLSLFDHRPPRRLAVVIFSKP